MTGKSVGLAAWIAATAEIMPELDEMVAAVIGAVVWVSLEPAMNIVICLVGPCFWNGDSGAYASGMSVPVAIVDMPGAWNAKLAFDADPDAIATCGKMSVKFDSPPLPATKWTLRAVVAQDAPSAMATPAVSDRTFRNLARGRPRAAASVALHL